MLPGIIDEIPPNIVSKSQKDYCKDGFGKLYKNFSKICVMDSFKNYLKNFFIQSFKDSCRKFSSEVLIGIFWGIPLENPWDIPLKISSEMSPRISRKVLHGRNSSKASPRFFEWILSRNLYINIFPRNLYINYSLERWLE